jgi:hypothetical protein
MLYFGDSLITCHLSTRLTFLTCLLFTLCSLLCADHHTAARLSLLLTRNTCSPTFIWMAFVTEENHEETQDDTWGLYGRSIHWLPITVAARSKAWTVCVRWNTGIVDSNPTWGMDILCACAILCALRRLIPHPRNPTDCRKIKKLKKQPRSNEGR